MKPSREQVRNNGQTYFVTSSTWERRPLFRSEAWAKLFVDHLRTNRSTSYLLHDFVLMPEHFHLILSPLGSLERSVQMIKGGFSFRANAKAVPLQKIEIECCFRCLECALLSMA